VIGTFLLLGLLQIPSAGAVGPALSASDSTRLHRDTRRAVEDFERFRETRIPAERGQGPGRCDEPVGRLCLNFPEGAASPIAPPPPPVQTARRELSQTLAQAAAQIPGDDWIAGQRVRYLVEAGDLLGAGRAIDECRGTPWWCRALEGWVLQEDGLWEEAGIAFLEVLDALPSADRERWQGELFLVERSARNWLSSGDPEERERRRARLWRLADPLYLIPGNDRWSEHMARLTLVRTLERAPNPFGLSWDLDLEELLLRYGWALGWERAQGAQSFQRLTQNRMVGRLDPNRRRYLPEGEDLESFPNTEEDGFRVLEGRIPSGYTPAYAPVVENLTSQTARFRRGNELLVAHAFSREDPRGPLPRDLVSALFLLPAEGPVVESNPRPVREGRELEGVWTVVIPNDTDRILSMEGFARLDRKGWRSRRGLARLSEPEGELALSDPFFILVEGEDPPATLEEALLAMRPSVRFRGNEQVRIGWELEGIPEGGVASVALGLERAERSALRRLGEFFRVMEPEAPVVIRWDDGVAETGGRIFRAVDLRLPALEAGRYDLVLEIRSEGEIPAVTRRRFVVTGNGTENEN
jgi:hypothetical protein